MKKLVYILSILATVLFTACNSGHNNESDLYTFFVAGHSAGYRWVDNKGLHPPFEAKFSLINARGAELGVLLGDIVFECTAEDWDEVDSVLQYLDARTYFAVGNHDMDDRQLFESRYGRTFFSFIHRGDLFIILDPNIDHWNISGEQLTFLKQELNNKAGEVRNIFVFFHQLLWWSPDNKYRKVKVNSLAERAPTINFWTEVVPLFKKLSNPVYMFAGDLGAGNWVKNYFYDTDGNITFVATGMGNDNADNFILVKVDQSGKVSFEMISLIDEDIHSLGKLEDYALP